MKKRLISICIVGILLCSIYQYAQSEKISPIAEFIEDNIDIGEEPSENKAIQDNEISEETEEAYQNNEVQQAEDGESAEPVYIIEPQLIQNDTYEMQDWQKAYAEYIEGFDGKESCYYSLIYMDDDEIPELVIDTRFEVSGCEILTFYNGKIDVLQTERLHFYYIEKKNLINNYGGKMGYYFDHIYSIENGKWVHIADGEYTEKMGEENLIYQYKWEGEEIDEEVYDTRLNEIFDMKQREKPEQYERLDEILFRLQMGTVLSQTHRYELYVEDVTWDEAERRCEEKGGYLAAITTIEEYEHIKKGIEDSGQTEIAYWVGASDDHPSSYSHIYEWHEPKRDSLKDIFISYTIMEKYWAEGEPGYYRKAADKEIDELGVYLLYDDAKEDCYLYDAPMDMLLRNPEYAGRIGYICEYDSVMVMAKETFRTADGNIDYWHEYEYDNAGNRIKDTVYGISDEGFWYGYEYEYDSTGNRIKEIHYAIDGSVDWWYEYGYDRTGNLTREFRYTANGSIECWNVYVYDYIGNLRKEIYHNADGSIGRWYEYEYDSAGNETKTTSYFGDGRFWYGYESEYDDVGNKTKNISYDADGSISRCEEWRWEYGYDSAGNRIKETRHDSNGKIIREYEYDIIGNLIKETRYEGNFMIEEWEYDNMGNVTMSKHTEYVDGEITDYSWNEYEYITIILH